MTDQEPQDEFAIAPETLDRIKNVLEKLSAFLPEPDPHLAHNIISSRTPPAMAAHFRKYLTSDVDEKSELDKFIRSKYGEGMTAKSDEFRLMVAAKMAYVANASLQSLMSAERTGSNPDVEGHLQRLLAMQGIRADLAEDILFGLQDFPQEIKERIRQEHQGKNPEGETEYNAYCQFLGLNPQESKQSLDQAVKMQKQPEGERKQKMEEVYDKHEPKKQKLR